MRQMKLGLSLATIGYHPAAWRLPDVPPDGGMDFRYYSRVVQAASRAKFDLIFLADVAAVRGVDDPNPGRSHSHQFVGHEPLSMLAALAAVTEDIGLVATASTTYNEPYNLARTLASIDHISGGRLGWNIVTSFSIEEARNYGLDTLVDSATRYGRAHEFIEVVRGLWDSWEADAFPRDKASGVFADLSRMNTLHHKGTHFAVRGPLNIARSPQRYPVSVTAGETEQARDTAARFADIVYAGQPTLEGARAYYTSVKERMARYGREPDELKVFPGIMAFVAPTQTEAEDKFARVQDLIDPLLGMNLLAPIFGDLSEFPVDAPFPADALSRRPDYYDFRPHDATAQRLTEKAQRENLTLRQVYQAAAEGYWHASAIGTPGQIADQMQEWFTTGAADGFNVLPAYMPGAMEDFAAMVIPELQRRGLFRTAYEGRTLRENLGLRPLDG